MNSGWLKILDVRGPRAFVGLVVCGGVSLAADRHLFAFAKAPAWIGLAANIGSLLFLGLTILWLAELISRPFRNILRGQNRRARIRSALEGLALEEWEILSGMIERRQKSVYAPIDDPTVHSLCAKGLLIQRSGTGNIRAWIYLMPDDVWKMLQASQPANISAS